MTRLIRQLFITVIFLTPFSIWATDYLDSLKKVAVGTIDVPETERFQAILELSRFSWASDPDSSLSLTTKALELAEEMNDSAMIGDALFDLGMIAYINGSFNTGLNHFKEAALSYQTVGDFFREANGYYQGGLCLKELKKFSEAVEWFENANAVLPENEFYQLTFSVANELGECYFLTGEIEKAESSYSEAIKISKFHEDTSAIITSHIEMGAFYNDISKTNEAIVEFNEAIKLTSPSNKQLLSQLYNHLGESYILKNNLEDAYASFNYALGLANESHSVVAKAKTHFNLSKLYEVQQKYALALIEYKLYTSLHDTINNLKTKDISSLQAKFDNANKDHEMKLKDIEMARSEAEADQKLKTEAFRRNVMIGGIIVVGMFGFLLLLAFRRQKRVNKQLDQLGMVAREMENTVIITDGLGNVEWINESYKRNYGLDLEEFKKRFGDNMFANPPNEEFKEKAQLARDEKKTVQFYISNKDAEGRPRDLKTTLTPRINEHGEIVNYILIDTEITDLRLAERQLTKQRDKLSSIYGQVTESIDYAKRIQEAVLPHATKINRLFPEYYLQYLPKDGVSGDFYFIEETDNYIYLAGADCTGHGVPGALMSVICYNLLENAVHRFSETDEILAEVNHQLIRKLRQSADDTEHIKDGLDIALVRLTKDETSRSLQFSGAHSAVYLLNDGVLTELKPSRVHLGQNKITREAFRKEDLEVEAGTELVFFSDGFPDQKGGPKGKKFYYPPFRELITTLNRLPSEEKLPHLNKVFNKWKIGKDQTDDVLVWGLKIKS